MSTAATEIELQPIAEPSTHDHASEQEFSLPPADTGREAWLFLAGAFMIEALVWGG